MSALRRLTTSTGIIAAGLCTGFVFSQEKVSIKRPAATEFNGLTPTAFTPLTISESTRISPDSNIIRFVLSDADKMPEFPCTSYILVKAIVNGEPVVRPYTPINCGKNSFINNKGELCLVVKAYPDGKLSKHLCSLPAGSSVEIKGPLAKFAFNPSEYETVTLIAGGSGVTPIYQILEEIADHCHKAGDAPKVNVLIANKTVNDILVKPLVDTYANKIASIEGANKVNVTYFVENLSENSPNNAKEFIASEDKSSSFKPGFINIDELRQLDGPSPKHKVFVCGPPGMMKAISGTKAPNYTQGEIGGALKDLGYEAEHVYKF